MLLDERLQSFTHIPAGAFEPAKVAARKTFVSSVKGRSVFRSADPHGYLIPDILIPDMDRIAWSGWGAGTSGPEQGKLDIEGSSIVFRVPTSEHPSTAIRQLVAGAETIYVFVGAPPSYPSDMPGIWQAPRLPEALSPVPAQELTLFGTLPALDLPPSPAPIEHAALRPDASVREIATGVSELSGLSDGELARLFRVTRETFQRWRSGHLRNPTAANRRRLGLLARLLDDLASRDVKVGEWLRNVSELDGLTPYELLARGRIDDVEWLAARVPGGEGPHEVIGADGRPVTRADALPAFARRAHEAWPEPPLQDDDEGWVDVEAELVGDDE